ncbi:MAG: nucleoside monophosphate kinase [Rickettsiales bacterium]|jgi:adenylate kinase|nr:nucleoside monophosphate kinase [Rickettsiales bacterium]
MARIVFIGPAGSGKGTQGALVSKYYGIPVISTGQLLRTRVKEGDDFGRQISSLINRGIYVSNDIILSLLAERLAKEDCAGGFIIDGFPRNVEQAVMLGEHLGPRGIDAAIVLNVPREVLFDRISGRHECGTCGTVYNKFFCRPRIEGVCDICGSNDLLMRDDDTDAETINRRLDTYEGMSKAMVDYYTEKNLIYSVDAVRSIQEVFKDIRNILDSVDVNNKFSEVTVG